jgi:MFS family permease
MKNNRALRVLFTFNSLFLFSASLMGPLYAIYVAKIGGGVLLISISTAVFFITSTLFLIFISRWGDKVKEKEYLLISSYLIRAVGYFSYIFLNSALWLVMIQVIFGLGDALGTPTFSALFAKHTNKNEEVMEYSDWTLVANLVMALGAIIGGFVVSIFGFGFLFVAMGVLCLVSAFGISITPRKVL